MSEPWKVGDRAKCVDVSDIRLPLRVIFATGGRYLRLGAVYPVLGLSVSYGTELSLEVGAEHGPKLAQRFVKAPPDEAEEAVGADVAEKVAA